VADYDGRMTTPRIWPDELLPGHVACGRCGCATPLHAAHRAHGRWGWRWPCYAWYAGPGPASRGRRWRDDAPAWLCSSCVLLARPAPVAPPLPLCAPVTSAPGAASERLSTALCVRRQINCAERHISCAAVSTLTAPSCTRSLRTPLHSSF